MQAFISVLLLIIGLLVGGIWGYSLGTVNMQEEAVVSGVAEFSEYQIDAEYKSVVDNKWKRSTDFEFRWLTPCGTK